MGRLLAVLLVGALPAAAAEWRHLFNGRDLTGWRVAGAAATPAFRVADGAICTQPGAGMLWYAVEKIGNSTLRVIYRMSNQRGNSGVFIRIPSPPSDEGFAAHHGIEVQIDDRDDPWHSTGTLYSMTEARAPRLQARRRVEYARH